MTCFSSLINDTIMRSAQYRANMRDNYLAGKVLLLEKTETSKKAYESIIDSIKFDLIEGRLNVGDKLPPERELAKQFGVSRTSIREALRTLEILGVTESIQGSGNFITRNCGKSLIESMSMMFLLQQINGLQISQLREALEIKAALLAVENITGEQVTRLQEIVKEMSVTRDERENVTLDKELHDIIALASNNRLIIQILHILSELISRDIKHHRQEILSNSENAPRLQLIHEEMVEGLKNRDALVIYQAVTKHFDIIAEHLIHSGQVR